MSGIVKRLGRVLPLGLRVELVRMRRAPSFWFERKTMALGKLAEEGEAQYSFRLAEHASPLNRSGKESGPLQAGKEHNVTLAASKLDRIVIRPGQVFSYHHAVGRPSRRRGFVPGLELHDGRMSEGVGGGCCQVSNMLYLVALLAGLDIVERHRHALDLFPDHGRQIPFGCGATVFYNASDLRLRNPRAWPVVLRFMVQDGELKGAILAERDPGWRISIREDAHKMWREGEIWRRENRIIRTTTGLDGKVEREEVVAENKARCLYDPEAAAC